MKSVSTILLLILSVTVYAFAQNSCDIIQGYSEFIKIEKLTFDERVLLHAKIVEPPKGTCYAELINANPRYAGYLLTNFSSHKNFPTLRKIHDSLALQKSYIEALQKDSTFNAAMNDWTKKTLESTQAKDTVELDKLLNIAVKFFSIANITDKGYYAVKICSGLNGIKSTEKVRLPQVEAFCFASIFDDLITKEGGYGIYNEFIGTSKQLYSVNLGIDTKKRLLRAQGALFLMMRNNETLKKLLIGSYEDKKMYLPFVLHYQNI